MKKVKKKITKSGGQFNMLMLQCPLVISSTFDLDEVEVLFSNVKHYLHVPAVSKFRRLEQLNVGVMMYHDTR